MAQDLEPNDSVEDAVPTLPIGPRGGYLVEHLSGEVWTSRNSDNPDPVDWYKVQYTGGVTSVSITSLGLWYARESTDGSEDRYMEIQFGDQHIYLNAHYIAGSSEPVFGMYIVGNEIENGDPSTYKQVPTFYVDPNKSTFLIGISGSVGWGGNSRPFSYDFDLSFSGLTSPTDLNDELYGQDGVDDTIHLLAGDDIYFGLSGNDTIYGERGNDTLDGGKGNDILDGGAGADTMRGGAGNDTYRVDNANDVVDEAQEGAGGIDLVRSSVTFSLSGKQALGDIENLTLIGLSIDGTGNDLNNVITGTTRDNKLSGLGGNDTLIGGHGNDTLDGGRGNDTLNGGSGNDKIDGGDGIDTAVFTKSKASYTLARLSDGSLTIKNGTEIDTLRNVEKVTFSDGTFDAVKLVPSGPGKSAPVITSGKGGAKASYTVSENTKEVVTVSAFDKDGSALMWSLSGTDAKLFTIDQAGALAFISAPDFEAPTDANMNNTYNVIVKVSDGKRSDTQSISVRVSDVDGRVSIGTSSADRLIGTEEADTLKGAAGDDMLFGRRGADHLWGGGGKDSFVFDTKLISSNIDTIHDFSVKNDTIWLDDDVFKKAGKVGDLSSKAFFIGTKAADRDDRIIYDSKSGKLWYDADGTGASKAIQFAILDKNLKMTAADFDIIA